MERTKFKLPILRRIIMTYLGMYLLLLLDGFNTTTTIVATACLIWAGIVYVITSTENCDTEVRKECIKELYADLSLKVGIISMFLAVFVPTTKQAALIYIAPKVINNEVIENVPEITKLGTEYLKELLKEKTDDIKR